MTWLAQVGHVMAKDVRQARWFLLVYLAVVALATAHALEWPAASGGVLDESMFLVVIAGMFLVAMVVQADSPTRSDAFWAARPFHPTAILGAKVLLALIVVMGPALLGQLAALARYELTAANLSLLLGWSARAYALWLLIAMVVAAVTKDLRGFTTAFTAVVVAFLLAIVAPFVSSVAPNAGTPAAGTVRTVVIPLLILVLGLGGSVGVLVVLYRRRGMRRRTWGAVIVATVCTFVSIFVEPPSRASSPGTLATVLTTDFALRVEVVERKQVPVQLDILVERTRPSGQLLVLDSGALMLRLRNDSTVRVPLGDRRIELGRPRLPATAGVRWLGGSFVEQSAYRQGVNLTRRQLDALRAGVTGAVIEGSVLALEPRVAARLPFRAGASYRSRGRRVQVEGVNPAADDSLATLSLSSISSMVGDFDPMVVRMSTWDAPRYVLENDIRGEAMIVGRGSSGSSSDALVLPGAWRIKGTAELRRGSERVELAKDAAWLGESQLLIIDWIPRGRAPLHAEATVGH